MLPISTSSNPGGKSCVRWPSKAGALRPGSRLKRRSRRPQPTGMPISIPLSGGGGGDISHLAPPRSSPSRSKLFVFSECTTRGCTKRLLEPVGGREYARKKRCKKGEEKEKKAGR